MATAGWPQQTRIAFDRLSIEEGLSQSIVEQIAQDPQGFLWFATEDGLNRFDGYAFTVFKNLTDDPESLSHNELEAVYADRSGAVWVGTFGGGLNRLDPATGRVTRYRHDPEDPYSLSDDTVLAILEDSSGALWIGTQNGGLNRLDRDRQRFERYPLSHEDVRVIFEDSTGLLWIGTNGGGLHLLDPRSGELTEYRASVEVPGTISDDLVVAITEDPSGALWVGTYGGGLNRLDPAAGRFVHYPANPDDPTALSTNLVRALRVDPGGVLWVGTDGGGLHRFDREREAFVRYGHDPSDPTSLSSDRVLSLFLDRSNVLWAGTYGGGLSKFDVGRSAFRHFRSDPEDADSLGHDIVWSIWEDRAGVLWVGTDQGGLDRYDAQSGEWRHYRHRPGDPTSLSHDAVRVVFEDDSGRLWLGTHGGGFNLFDRESERCTRFQHDPDHLNTLAHDELRSMTQDSSGALWIGTFGGGLDRFDPESGSFTHYRHDPEDSDSLSSDFIRTVVEDREGVLWIGTQGGGLDRLEPGSGRIRHYRHDADDPSSLANDFVFAVHEAADGELWIGTYGAGLDRFDRETGSFRHFTSRQGLTSDSIYGILEDDAGRLWISTTKGLSRFDPRTETFRNFDAGDGLQSNEFNGNSCHRGASGTLYFGGIHGFNAFDPGEIRINQAIPAVVITDLRLFNRAIDVGDIWRGRVVLERPISFSEAVELAYGDDVVSLGFTALHYSAPEKNRYAYQLEGFSDTWIEVGADRRFATFTGLAPGEYVFRVRGASNDGVWSSEAAALRITVTPPFWATWWFRLTVLAATAIIGWVSYRSHVRNVRMKTELRAAHDAQMAIMPHSAPELEGFEISGSCIPAHEVGGDFFDYFWLDLDRRRLCVAVGDVAGAAMKAAMTAVMTDGMLVSRAGRADSVAAILTSLNRSLHGKVREHMFAALCVVVLDADSGELTFANAGLCEPLHRSDRGTDYLESHGPKTPLGTIADAEYQERSLWLLPGETLILFSDGIPETRNPAGELYGYEAPRKLLASLDTVRLSAQEIQEMVLADVRQFADSPHPSDDIALVVIKAGGL